MVTAAVRQGDTLEIQFQYDADDATQLSTSIDLFEGKGQRPRDVNKFLSYHGPMEMKTTVASGTSSYDVAIYYGDTIDPSSFEAEFNKQDVTDLFSPEAGKAEIVQLPLDKKRNTLVVSVDGVRDDGKTATDSDRLVFIVE